MSIFFISFPEFHIPNAFFPNDSAILYINLIIACHKLLNTDFSVCLTRDTYNDGFFYLGKDCKTIYYYNIDDDTMDDIYVCDEKIILMDYSDESICFVTESGLYYHYNGESFIPMLQDSLNYYTQN